MPSRVIVFFLAVVLLWSGLGTIEAPHVLAQPAPAHRDAIVHASGQGVVHAGSLEHHHLDDLPTQVPTDPLAELPDLLPSPLVPGTPPLVMARLRAPPTAAVAPPLLAGLLRPPSCAFRAG